MSLTPYLYSAFAEYHNIGKPPFRPLVMDYSNDPNTWSVDDEYMMGDSLLVAPMFTGEKERSVYLPTGKWYSFYDGKEYEGNKKHQITMGIERIPIFVRGGSLVPLAAPVQHISQDTVFDITVKVFGANPQPFTLYADDGITYNYEKGQNNQTVLSWNPAGRGEVKLTGKYHVQRYNIVGWEEKGEGGR